MKDRTLKRSDRTIQSTRARRDGYATSASRNLLCDVPPVGAGVLNETMPSEFEQHLVEALRLLIKEQP